MAKLQIDVRLMFIFWLKCKWGYCLEWEGCKTWVVLVNNKLI